MGAKKDKDKKRKKRTALVIIDMQEAFRGKISDFAEVAAAFGIESATVRTIDELRALGPRLANREGPLLVDCKVVSTVIAPFLSE